MLIRLRKLGFVLPPNAKPPEKLWRILPRMLGLNSFLPTKVRVEPRKVKLLAGEQKATGKSWSPFKWRVAVSPIQPGLENGLDVANL